jgi:hypothetical protein
MGAPTRIRTSDSLIGVSDSLIGDSGRPTGETAEPEGTEPAEVRSQPRRRGSSISWPACRFLGHLVLRLYSPALLQDSCNALQTQGRLLELNLKSSFRIELLCPALQGPVSGFLYFSGSETEVHVSEQDFWIIVDALGAWSHQLQRTSEIFDSFSTTI